MLYDRPSALKGVGGGGRFFCEENEVRRVLVKTQLCCALNAFFVNVLED